MSGWEKDEKSIVLIRKEKLILVKVERFSPQNNKCRVIKVEIVELLLSDLIVV